MPIARWLADMRVRRLVRAWHEPAMPATWKERFTEQTQDKNTVLWAIDVDGGLVGMIHAGFGWEPHYGVSGIHGDICVKEESIIPLSLHAQKHSNLRRIALIRSKEQGRSPPFNMILLPPVLCWRRAWRSAES